MDKSLFTAPPLFKNITLTDRFWKEKDELIRKEVIPYQWEALNDRIEGAEPSWCIHNFKAAARLQERIRRGEKPPVYTGKSLQTLPSDPSSPDPNEFYGFVFQDTDLYKWLEAVAYSLVAHPDEELEKLADGAIELVCAAQADSGYLDTFYILNGMDRIFTNLRDNHELYCFGHLTQAACAYYLCTGKDRLLKAAMRFADLLCGTFGEEDGRIHGYPGHEIAEMALAQLYEITKDRKYLTLAKYFIDQRGKQPCYFEECEEHDTPTDPSYHQAHLPLRLQEDAVGHAVRATYLYSGAADVARLTDDILLKETAARLWKSITEKRMYITGGIGSTHIGEAFTFDYDLPNDTAYTETCASIGMVFFAQRMLRIAPDSRYADVMELELYNNVLSGMAEDGKSFFYVNPLDVRPVECEKDRRKEHVKASRQKWFGCACCPPNLARLISSLGSYIYTENSDSLYVHLYVSSVLRTRIGGRPAEITLESDVPADGDAKLRIKLADGERARGKLYLRMPFWCSGAPVLRINGKDTVPDIKENGYILIEGDFSDDEIDLSFPMKAAAVAADPRIKEDIGKIAFMRGPVVYCMEEADNGKGLYRISADPTAPIEVYKENGRILLKAKGSRPMEDTGKGLYRLWHEQPREAVEITLIPYANWNNRGEGEMTVWISESHGIDKEC